MKKKSGKLLLMLCVTLLCTLFLSMTALAAEEKGALTAVDENHITGWLRDNAESDETAAVELHIYKDGAAKRQRSSQYRKKATAKRQESPMETAAVHLTIRSAGKK